MKLSYIANARIPTEKAHGVQIMKMCEAFSDVGVQVELIVSRRFNSIQDNPFSFYGVRKNFKIRRLPCLDLVKFGKLGFYVQSLTFAVSSFFYVIFKKSDIIYSRDELPLYFLSFLKNKKLFWETHTAKENFIVKSLLKKITGVVSITEGLKNFYIEKYNTSSEKIFVAPDGVDLKDFDINLSKKSLREELGLPQDRKIISYIGKYKTMGEGKGVNILIESFQQIINQFPEAFLLIVGLNKNEVSEISELFENFNIDKDNYKIVTHISRKNVACYLKSSDILVMTYPKKEHYEKYMSPLKLFEYMASGVPIVSSDLPSIREILNEDNSVLVNSDNRENFSKGIAKILKNKVLYDDATKKILLDVKKYTWKKRVENILRFISI